MRNFNFIQFVVAISIALATLAFYYAVISTKFEASGLCFSLSFTISILLVSYKYNKNIN
jgi:hypothetical protein